MNCDDAFDALTDPARRDSEDLQWHLGLCPRCRQMRDVLHPALGLFAPSAEELDGDGWMEDEPLDFDGPQEPEERYRTPFLSPETLQLAEQAAAELAVRRLPAVSSRKVNDRRLHSSALMVAGIAAAFVLGLWLAGDGSPADRAPAGDSACVWQSGPEKRTDAAETPRTVALSCVACHLDGRTSSTRHFTEPASGAAEVLRAL